MQVSAAVGLLSSRQLLFADEFSQVVVYESSQYDHETSSDDGQGEVLDRAKVRAVKKMIRSKDQTDQRLIDMIRVQYAQQLGINLKFKSLKLKSE